MSNPNDDLFADQARQICMLILTMVAGELRPINELLANAFMSIVAADKAGVGVDEDPDFFRGINGLVSSQTTTSRHAVVAAAGMPIGTDPNGTRTNEAHREIGGIQHAWALAHKLVRGRAISEMLYAALASDDMSADECVGAAQQILGRILECAGVWSVSLDFTSRFRHQVLRIVTPPSHPSA